MPLKVFFEVIDVKEKNGYKQFSIPWYIDRQSSVKNQQKNIPSNNTFHILPFYLRYPRQSWLNFK